MTGFEPPLFEGVGMCEPSTLCPSQSGAIPWMCMDILWGPYPPRIIGQKWVAPPFEFFRIFAQGIKMGGGGWTKVHNPPTEQVQVRY